jgi:hypothetical protein
VLDPSTIFIVTFVLIWTIGLVLGAAYLRGGRQAVRRALPQVAIIVAIGPVVLVVLAVESIVSHGFNDLTFGVVLLPVVLITFVVQIRRLRRQEATARAAGRPAAFTPAIRRFAIAWILVMVIGTILLSYVAARAGY